MDRFPDELLTRARPVRARPAGPRRRLSGAEVRTTAVAAARCFGGNLAPDRRYTEQHRDMKALDKSGFARHLHRLSDTLLGLFAPFGQALKALHPGARCVIDSFPVAVCQNSRPTLQAARPCGLPRAQGQQAPVVLRLPGAKRGRHRRRAGGL